MKSFIKGLMIFFGGLYLWEKRDTIREVVCNACPKKDAPDLTDKIT